jgi:hypothetical protein
MAGLEQRGAARVHRPGQPAFHRFGDHVP